MPLSALSSSSPSASHRPVVPVKDCAALVLLQTRRSLTTASVLCDIWEALKHRMPIVPVVLDDAGRALLVKQSARLRHLASDRAAAD